MRQACVISTTAGDDEEPRTTSTDRQSQRREDSASLTWKYSIIWPGVVSEAEADAELKTVSTSRSGEREEDWNNTEAIGQTLRYATILPESAQVKLLRVMMTESITTAKRRVCSVLLILTNTICREVRNSSTQLPQTSFKKTFQAQ